MSTVTVKRNDVGVIFSDTLTAEGMDDLDDVADVLFIMRHKVTPEVVLEAPGEVVDSSARTVRYVAQVGDLDEAGWYRQEWQVTFDDNAVLTFPSQGWNYVHISGDLNPEGS